jgi:predicted RNA binding protein YcfA (HicA-like mRNA interferase family)
MAVDRKHLADWLLSKGFQELPRNSSGHRYFELKGFKVAVPAHGKKDLEPRIITLLARNMARLGFDQKKVKEELLR